MPPKINDARRWLEVLGLAPGATKQELDDAYRDLVKVWHPDRFQSDPTLRLKAQEKLRDLNAAYEGLRRSGIPPPDPVPTAAPQAPAWKKGPATSETRSARWGIVWGFGSVLIATAAVVAIVLSVGMRRDAVVATDIVLAPAPQPRKPAREPQRTEPAPPARPTVGALMVLSEPSGGTVYVNDQQVGHTPLTLPSLVPGAYRVRVELGNYPSWSSPVQIDAGASEKLIAFMEKRGVP
jgi:hypothetical protein